MRATYVRLRAFMIAAIAAAACLTLSSCLSLPQSLEMISSQLAGTGWMNDSRRALLFGQASRAALEAARRLSPEEEYYLGRAVAAEIFALYPPRGEPRIDEYLNLLGQGLAQYSRRPALFRGYSFLALESGKVNAFASPGGHILVTMGLVRLAADEDELAAVLAHEIAHVALRHGVSSIHSARLTKIASGFLIGAGKMQGGKTGAFASEFGEAISDMAGILVVSGYSRTFELQADREARRILALAGYDPDALSSLIARLPSPGDEDKGYISTHPDPEFRIRMLAAQPVPSWRAKWRPFLSGSDDFGSPAACEGFSAFGVEMRSDSIPSLLAAGQIDGQAAPLAMVRRERFAEMRRLF